MPAKWSYEVGMPAKSGVSGCIMAVIPGQVGVGVYSPPLDAQGNSVRGIKVCLIIREGDQAKLFFVLARGSVSVQIKVPTQTGEKRRRVASLGPGLTFGEMSLFGGGSRSADVIADEKVICYGLAVDELKELTAEHPNIMMTILSNLTRDFAERLRHANQAIRSLE